MQPALCEACAPAWAAASRSAISSTLGASKGTTGVACAASGSRRGSRARSSSVTVAALTTVAPSFKRSRGCCCRRLQVRGTILPQCLASPPPHSAGSRHPAVTLTFSASCASRLRFRSSSRRSVRSWLRRPADSALNSASSRAVLAACASTSATRCEASCTPQSVS